MGTTSDVFIIVISYRFSDFVPAPGRVVPNHLPYSTFGAVSAKGNPSVDSLPRRNSLCRSEDGLTKIDFGMCRFTSSTSPSPEPRSLRTARLGDHGSCSERPNRSISSLLDMWHYAVRGQRITADPAMQRIAPATSKRSGAVFSTSHNHANEATI